MNHSFSSIFGFGSTLAAALLGAAVMTTDARAEGPIGESGPFTSSTTRAEVRAELMKSPQLATSFANEWRLQGGEPVQIARGRTRAQAQAEYIAARNQVLAMNSEHGGSGYFAGSTMRSPDTLVAGGLAR